MSSCARSLIDADLRLCGALIRRVLDNTHRMIPGITYDDDMLDIHGLPIPAEMTIDVYDAGPAEVGFVVSDYIRLTPAHLGALGAVDCKRIIAAFRRHVPRARIAYLDGEAIKLGPAVGSRPSVKYQYADGAITLRWSETTIRCPSVDVFEKMIAGGPF
jgi:hypothetical protein